MKIRHTLLWTLVFAISFFCACNTGSGSGSETGTKVLDKSALMENISSAEGDLYDNYTSLTKNGSKAEAVLKAYDEFISAEPDDPSTPNYMFKAAEIERTLKRYKEAINRYEQISEKYTTFEKAPHSLFLMGFTYEEDLKDPQKAKAIYEKFLQKYPKHELSDDVAFSLKHIGESADDIIRRFEDEKGG